MNWLRLRFFSYAVSSLFILTGIVGLLLGGLKPALEFTGGSELTIESDVETAALQEAVYSAEAVLGENKRVLDIRTVQNQAIIVLDEINFEDKEVYLAQVQQKLNQPVTEVSFQTVGPAFSSELIIKTLYAIVLGIVSILLYLWWQFKSWRFGVAGILAMGHDSFILLGSFAWLGLLMGIKVDLLFVTALLTTLSFSVHDTIVIFDRIRELRLEKGRSHDEKWIINTAITQTLPRSLNNSLTIIFMLLALLLLGGESLRWFSLALLIGTITGTYSSTFTAVPLYYDSQKIQK
jgi:preprotein translocase subunit SecF